MIPHLAVVMPCYSEEGLPAFLVELETHLASVATRRTYFVVDDLSPTPTADTLAGLPPGLDVVVSRNEVNLGHGPSALRAYELGWNSAADVVLHVDADGQFHGDDVARLVGRLGAGAGIVGLRTRRVDPWFRKVITAVARHIVAPGLDAADANSPLRSYRRDHLRRLLDAVDHRSSVPHLAFTLLEHRWGADVASTPVRHRARLGTTASGTTWRGSPLSGLLPTKKLLTFSLAAAQEITRFRHELESAALDRAPVTVPVTGGAELVEQAA